MPALSRLAAVLATTATAAALVAVPALSAQAAAKDDGMQLVVPALATMLPGQQGWISAMWKATTDVCDVRVTASAPGLTIGYPANTATYTSLYEADKLAADAMDFTALNVSVPAGASGPVEVTLNVSYTRLPPGQAKKDDPAVVEKFDCKGPKGGQTVTATLPVASASGVAVVQKTGAVTVSKDAPSWEKIAFEGRRSGLSDFRLTLTAPQGLEVVYPGERTSAGLHTGSTLAVAREDYAAVRLDASGLAAGTYRVPVRATYTGGGYDGELTLTVR
ncbi:hypothetical protein [Planomonospora venezuelensis]|uniref:Uncharacterized protein n=1 Tax=Planomonospora venezuelensis TaxID=1999 RepID=A0A841DFX1_PLAVE|nr:hypothetical protein [Planomonospora venezuelensis]MBB5967623.1 hypothetical protein [Planomonospora venezuelensis]GIN00275.1 hypothetical protein Pve01_19330 [Planomonospora venezuelensis]